MFVGNELDYKQYFSKLCQPFMSIKPYFQTDSGSLYHGDCLEIMPQLKEQASLICIDPPYNIGKDTWDKIKDYQDWMGRVVTACQAKLKDNGSFYWFHNQMPVIAKLMNWIEDNTDFIFKQFIVWNKRFYLSKNVHYMNGYVCEDMLRNYRKMVEYCLFYTFQDDDSLDLIFCGKNNFTSIKTYLKLEKEKVKKHYNFNNAEFNQYTLKIGCSTTPYKNWFCNKSYWEMPSELQYKLIQSTGYFKKSYKELHKEYEKLRKEYEGLRYTFNNQKTDHSVWEYEISEKIGHLTPKPVPLISNILKHSSNPGDLVLDCFLGSGTTAIACENLNRRWVGIEKEEKYCEIAAKRIEQTVSQIRF